MEDTSPATGSSVAAPVSTPSAPSGESTAPVAAPSTPSKPASMKEAFAQTAAKREAVEGTAPATAAPASADGLPATKQGPIPFEVHSTALKNAREKAIEEYRQKVGWAEQIPQEQFTKMQSWFQRAAQDPIAFTQELVAELNAHPVHSQSLRSLAAKALAQGRGQSQTQEMPQPDVQITDEQGNVVGRTYSDRQQQRRDAWLTQKVVAQVDEKYAPVVETHQQLAQERAQLKAETEAKSWSSGFTKELGAYPHFETHKTDIGKEVQRLLTQLPPNDPRADQPAFLEALTLRAYHTVVEPHRAAADRASTLATLKGKAVAQVESPSGTAPVSTKRPRTPQELAKFMEQKAQQRGTA